MRSSWAISCYQGVPVIIFVLTFDDESPNGPFQMFLIQFYALLLCDHGMYEYGRAELCTERIEGCEVVRLWGSYPLWSSVRGDRDGPGSPESRSRHSSGDRWSEISLRRDHGARGHQTHSLWPFQKWTEQRTCGEINCSNDYHTRHLLKYLSSSLSSAGFAKQKGVWEYIFIKPLSQ